MAVKFFIVFASILLYMLIWMVLLVPVALAVNNGQDEALWLLLVMVLLIFILFPPYLNFATKRTFYFAGEGEPVPASELRQALLAVNEFDAPITAVARSENHIVFTWRYVDAKWWAVLSKAGLEKVYECHVKLDERTHTATLIDVSKSVSWRAGPEQVQVGFIGFRGVEMSYERGAAWGIQENFGVGEIYNYEFTNSEIKNPVLNTILRYGWDVRMGMW